MSSNHLILCHPLLLLRSIFPSIRVFPKESAVCIRWWFRFGVSGLVLPLNIQGWISLRMNWFISLLSKGLSRVFSSTRVWKHQFFRAPSIRCNNQTLMLVALFLSLSVMHTHTHTHISHTVSVTQHKNSPSSWPVHSCKVSQELPSWMAVWTASSKECIWLVFFLFWLITSPQTSFQPSALLIHRPGGRKQENSLTEDFRGQSWRWCIHHVYPHSVA